MMPRIKTPPSRGLSYIVVIPAYLEDAVDKTLQSLQNTVRIQDAIEVLVVVNYSESDTEENKTTNQDHYKQLLTWCKEKSREGLWFYPLLAADLPTKHAGAGLARKIGMDEACYRFGCIENAGGVILSLDADTQVRPDYFTAIEKEFLSESRFGGCILPFAHPVEGSDFSDEIYRAIILYELHLRYYRQALRFSGFPYSYYTIGSCFGVRADLYARQGGMNRRKAGEDFYFLNKLFPHKPFCEIKGTCVYPSPRPSARVPFGTGPVIQQLIDSDTQEYVTYNLQAFIDLKKMFGTISELFDQNTGNYNPFIAQLPAPLQTFLEKNNIENKLREIKKNTATVSSFCKRFFLWFDGFKVVKYLNFSHNNSYKKIEVSKAANGLLTLLNMKDSEANALSLLKRFREMDYNPE